MLISIILPIYNMEDKLQRCMESIFKQQGAELEIIMVDDGSRDKTPSICDEYGRMDQRITVIHQENRGLSGARNAGMSAAKGEYLWFIDPDDTIPDDALQTLVNVTQNGKYDLIRGTHWRVSPNGTKSLHRHSWDEGIADKYGSETEVTRFRRLMTDWTFGNAWSGFYRRDFLTKANIQFEDTKEIYLEDILFNSKLWTCRPSCYLLEKAVYNYYDNPGSLLNRADPKRSSKLLNLLTNYYDFLQKQQALDGNLDLMASLFARYLCWMGFDSAAGHSLSLTVNCIRQYGENRQLRNLIEEKNIFAEIRKLVRPEDRILYSHCLKLLKKRHYRLMAAEFHILTPILELYKKIFSRD